MAQLWEVPPAGTPFAPNRINNTFTRSVYSRVPISGTQWQAGRTAQFAFKSTSTDLVHLPSSRIVVRMKLTDGNGAEMPPSIRLQSDVVNTLFSQAKYSINGTVVSSCGANYSDLSNVHHRLNDTLSGETTAGSLGMIGFQKKMHPAAQGGPISSSPADVTAAKLGPDEMFPGEYNPKVEVLNVAGIGEFEVASTPCLPFWKTQGKALGQNLDHLLECTVATDFEKHALFSEALLSQPSNNTAKFTDTNGSGTVTATGVHGTGAALHSITAGILVPLATAATLACPNSNVSLRSVAQGGSVADATWTASHTNLGHGVQLSITDIYLQLCIIQPRAPGIPRPLSCQYHWEDYTILSRTLDDTTNHVQTFTVPISSKRFFVAFREASVSLNIDREAYDGGAYLREFSLQRGSMIQPLPSYQVNPDKLQVGRMFDDYMRINGTSSVNGKGGRDLFTFCKEPCILVGSTSEESSTNVTLRFTMSQGSMTNYEILLVCMHSRVLETTVDESGTPVSVLVDELVF